MTIAVRTGGDVADRNAMYRVRIPADGKPFSDRYANNLYEAQPGQEIYVPFGAIDCWFGDPNKINIDESRRPRLEQLNHLKGKYGGAASQEDWENNKPQVEVYTMTGERVYTIIDDEDGVRITPQTQTARENDEMRATMLSMQQQLEAMKAAMSEKDKIAASEELNALDEVPDDTIPAPASEEVPVDEPDRTPSPKIPWA